MGSQRRSDAAPTRAIGPTALSVLLQQQHKRRVQGFTTAGAAKREDRALSHYERSGPAPRRFSGQPRASRVTRMEAQPLPKPKAQASKAPPAIWTRPITSIPTGRIIMC